ncbi:MAG: nucleotidyltransferase domain-containing protein [Anaerolineae bacterium]
MKGNEPLQRLSGRDREALVDFVARLRRQFNHDNIRHVWVFGSKIRGEAEPDSDIDLLIVVHDYDWTLEKVMTRVAVETDLAHDVVLSDHIVNAERYAQMVTRNEPLYRSIEREGVDLWKAELQPTT